MANPLAVHRHSAYLAQQGRCYYCGLPMWEDDLESFCRDHNINPSQAQLLQCTAEHLHARQDGGLDTADNIVAACLRCNRSRHVGKRNPSPCDYAQLVRKALRNGAWHRKSLMRAFEALMTCRNSQGQAAP